MEKGKWDSVAEMFDVHSEDASKIDPGAADNIMVVWPVITKLLGAPPGRILEFGCGTGGLCQNLFKRGFDVTGIDASSRMVEIAKRKSNPKINFVHGSTNALEGFKAFDAFISVMVFQFIEDPKPIFGYASSALREKGLLSFAVHNPAYVAAWSDSPDRFQGYDKQSKRADLIIKNEKFGLFIRDTDDYDQMLLPLGFQKILETCPPFPKEYYERYAGSEDANVCDQEFLILAYRKA